MDCYDNTRNTVKKETRLFQEKNEFRFCRLELIAKEINTNQSRFGSEQDPKTKRGQDTGKEGTKLDQRGGKVGAKGE